MKGEHQGGAKGFTNPPVGGEVEGEGLVLQVLENYEGAQEYRGQFLGGKFLL